MQNRHNRDFFGFNFNPLTANLLIQQDSDEGNPFPVPTGDFFLLNNTNFLLLDGTNFLLL